MIKKLRQRLATLASERASYDPIAKQISNYIVPGRGVYNNFSRPQIKRKFTKECINSAASDASDVLTSGLQAGLVSPSRPWFKYYFPNKDLRRVKAFTDWLYRLEQVTYDILAESNFYSTVSSFFTEVVNFGTCPIYVGEDAGPVRFHMLTWGEYFIDTNAKNEVNTLFRIIYLKAGALIEEYGDKVPEGIRRTYKQRGDLGQYFVVIEAVTEEKFQRDKNFKSVHFLYNAPAAYALRKDDEVFQKPLRISGYYEFPYPTGRWSVIGSEVYGWGIGAKILPTVMRLQELEKSHLMMVHKEADPPVNVPARLKGQEDLFPGGKNYYSNPQEKVEEIVRRQYGHTGILASIARIEERVAKAYYNDIFLTAARDPNASPYKAAEVHARDAEKTLRLGPSIEMLGTSPFKPLLDRVVNIAIRKGYVEPPPGQLIDMGEDYGISMIGVLAQAQKAMAAQPMYEYIQSVTAIAQLDPAVFDNTDTDALHDELADIKGVPSIVLKDKDAVRNIREQRAKAQAEQKAKEDAALQSQLQGQTGQQVADQAKTMSEASVNYNQILST